MLRRAVTSVAIGGTGIAIAYLAALGYVAHHSWFGVGDLWSFLFWTLPFGVLLSFTALALDKDLRQWRRLPSILASLAVGLVLAILWAFAVRVVIGPWFHAFSFPVPYFWMAGAVISLSAPRWFRARAVNIPCDRDTAGTGPSRWPLMRRTLVYLVGLPALASVLAVGTVIGGVAASWVMNRAEPELHLIPTGYMGNVYVIHDVADAAAPEYEDGRRVYRIAPDGIHLSRLPGNPGWQDVRYYYVSADGTRVEITERWVSSIHDTEDNRSDATTLGIFFPRSGTLETTVPKCDISYDQYYVGSKKYLLTASPAEFLSKYLEMNPHVCSSQHGA